MMGPDGRTADGRSDTQNFRRVQHNTPPLFVAGHKKIKLSSAEICLAL